MCCDRGERPTRVCTVCHYINTFTKAIKALKVLVGRLSLNVGWESGPERGRKTVSFNPLLPVI